MTFTNEELGQLLDLLKKKGVYRFKNGGFEVEFGGIDEVVPMEDSPQIPDITEEKAPSEFELHKSFQQL